ncbi:N/A [soil metagenome]
MQFLTEPERQLPVVGEFDLCVLGGSCTGVFAAVRAARLGLSVAIIERMGCFGGVATLSLVNVWHSSLDERFEKQIFAGLTVELMDRLRQRQAVTDHPNSPHYAWVFNSAELQIELDELVLENGITPFLHTSFAAPHVEAGRLRAVVVENKDGRQAIRARFFIDATGDGDLCQRLGLETYRAGLIQPATTCALFSGWDKLTGTDWGKLVREHGDEYGLPPGFAWGARVPSSDLYMLAGTRVRQDCSSAKGFTAAEIEGRRQVRAIHDILRRYSPETPVTLQSLPARIGIRETRHVRCLHHLTGEEILTGQTFADEIAHGSYRVDIHHPDKAGITLRYLDGREEYCRPGLPTESSRWRTESPDSPTWYSIPYRSLVPQGPIDNLLIAGRFIDADEEAHAAIRVMVNMNQTGEAAGVAAFVALRDGTSAAQADHQEIRTLLLDGGSLFPRA